MGVINKKDITRIAKWHKENSENGQMLPIPEGNKDTCSSTIWENGLNTHSRNNGQSRYWQHKRQDEDKI